MRSLRAVALVGTVLALALVAAPGASASVEVGDKCAGNEANEAFSLVPEVRAAGDGLPLTAPADGVVTAWKINSAHSAPVPEWPAAFRSDKAGTFQVVGEGTEILVSQGLNVFPARVPVRAGDRFGLIATGENSPLYCFTGSTGDVTWSFRGGIGPGSIHTFAAGGEVLVPLVAVIEPDKDGDGYGDETQDGCPQSAAYQGPCPAISLDSFPIVLKRSVLVLVGASESASVQVFGQVGWRPRHKGGALASKQTKKPGGHGSAGVTIGLSGGMTTVRPGEVTPFNVKLPKSVLSHLGQISPKRVVKGTITARTTDLAGRITEHTIAIRLHGRARGNTGP